ncbi:hypothetical protein [Mycetohabitans rhizoxinica]|uniref:hypothetical protein n=1 Tax=Mycetohabitans rhizoxinica TaxID=412963 RepID=UPI0030D1C56A
MPVSCACIDALRAYWADRGEDFNVLANALPDTQPLLAPLVIPPRSRAQQWHATGEASYRADTLACLVSVRGDCSMKPRGFMPSPQPRRRPEPAQ